MNLYDLVKRQDVNLSYVNGDAVAAVVKTAAGAQRAVVLAPGSELRLANAQSLTVLKVLAADLGWSWMGDTAMAEELQFFMHITEPAAAELPLPVRMLGHANGGTALLFDWPTQAVLAVAFDLVIRVGLHAAQTLLVGLVFNMRAQVLPLARGIGVEVGPGLRPHVLPSSQVDVSYVEQEDPHAWPSLYQKTGTRPELPPEEVLKRYRRSSAVTLDSYAPLSLDFIFSNHVFEHLPNPLLVLRNWLEVVKPGGLIMGVVPDPRYTFDCRQPPTTVEEALDEEGAGGHTITMEKYERWCRYTEPRHTPRDLIARGYSIHVNFFTPESLRSALMVLYQRGWIDHVFVSSAPNHKDFAFLIRKAVPR